jgi:hypothetical protein
MPLDGPICRCGRTLRLLNTHPYYGPASDTPRCPTCGYISELCACPPEAVTPPQPEAAQVQASAPRLARAADAGGKRPRGRPRKVRP